MTPELERLFFETVDLEPEARRRYLDEHCRDPQLREQVERLLRSDRVAEQFLGAPVVKLANRMESTAAAPGAATILNRRVGPYRILREIGRGGMGAVYEAERLDGEVRLKVAIKFVPPKLRNTAVLEKFRQERQILASLDHPNIARLLDAGTAADGSPYVVMELVNGEPIDEWCRKRNATPREIVALFLPVCSAVSHAHLNLVVHRDLKPQNILVTPAGQPKLLDFGIAKLIDEEHRNEKTAVRALTPDYAAPEQLDNGAVTTATDVFGLGCVLYKLLTGAPPKRDLRSPLDSTLPRASALKRELGGDLDHILARALHPRAEQRYATAGEFAAELKRYLAHRPVQASPRGWGYLASRFVRRNPALVLAVSALVLSVALGTGISIWQARRAQQRFAEVRDLANRFLFQFDERIRDVPGTINARRYVVATALEYLEKLARDSGSDQGLRNELAAGYRRISEVQWSAGAPSLGDADAAAASARRARELLEQSPPGEEYARVLLCSGELEDEFGNPQKAYEFSRRAREIADASLKKEPSNAAALDLASTASVLSSRALRENGSAEEARLAAGRAVSLDQLALRAGNDGAALRLAASLGAQALAELACGRAENALATAQQAVDHLRALDQSRGFAGRALMVALERLAEVGSAPLPPLSEAFAIAQRRAEKDPADYRALLDLERAATRYGSALTAAGQLDAALRVAPFADNHAALDAFPKTRESRRARADALAWLASFRRATGDPARALDSARAAASIYRDLLSANSRNSEIAAAFIRNQSVLAQLADTPAAKSKACDDAAEVIGRFSLTAELPEVCR